ncbi:MAG: DUF2088 domain-containing protein [Oscillospiraceae bacterium]|nr:DUF2088 domain-containing protein [Oscillospiraceae bacterium]
MNYSLQNKEQSVSKQEVVRLLDRHMADNSWSSVLLLPPDITRSHSGAGLITAHYYEQLTAKGVSVKVLPALGTHLPMTEEQLREMFGDSIPMDAYIAHDFRNGIEVVGTVPGSYLDEVSEGLFKDDVTVSVNKELLSGKYDAIISIGQVVPHELAGFAGYTKNLVVGCGGGEMINVSHFLGVFYGRHRIVGEVNTPPRRLFDYIQKHFLDKLPITFVLTVMAQQDDEDLFKGIFIGKERDGFEQAVALSQQVNITHVEKPAKKCVVWMDPHSYHSTWVTNKAIYRTQKAVAEDGEIIVIAPGMHTFGENDLADQAIRKYGYRPREEMLELYKTDPLLSSNMSLAGHLIRSVPSARTKLTYCTNKLTREEIEHANFCYMTVEEALALYPCEDWQTGWKTLPNGEEIYFVRNAALGLWQYDASEPS